MKASTIIITLASITGLLGGIAAGVGLFLDRPGEPFAFTTLRGQEVDIYGRGLYRFDSLLTGAGYRGQDAVALFLGIPILIIAILLYQRGSLAGQYLLTGILGVFLYLYSSMALGAAFNPLFLMYVATFGVSLFGFIFVFNDTTLRISALDGQVDLLKQGLDTFMIISGIATLVYWIAPFISATLQGVLTVHISRYTTLVNFAINLAVITPAMFISAYLIRRQSAAGIVLASPLVVLLIFLAPQTVLTTLFQNLAGVSLPAVEIIISIALFIILGGFGLWFLLNIMRSISKIEQEVESI